MKRAMFFRRILLIYQMPKVGSQTIEWTLRRSGFPYPVWRFHFLSPTIADNLRRALRRPAVSETWKRDALGQLRIMRQLSVALRVRRMLTACGVRIPKVEAISAVREPLGLGLSSIFQNLSFMFAERKEVTAELCAQELQRPLVLKHLQEWFNLELKPYLGVDVFAKEFPRDQGYAIYENRFARVLVYRYEALPALPQMLRDFLQLDSVQVISRNIGAEKPYGEVYRRLQREVRLPREFVNAHCSSRMMRHFYSEEERRRFCERWSLPQTAAPLEAMAGAAQAS
jgi:hypothetical protein